MRSITIIRTAAAAHRIWPISPANCRSGTATICKARRCFMIVTMLNCKLEIDNMLEGDTALLGLAVGGQVGIFTPEILDAGYITLTLGGSSSLYLLKHFSELSEPEREQIQLWLETLLHKASENLNMD